MNHKLEESIVRLPKATISHRKDLPPLLFEPSSFPLTPLERWKRKVEREENKRFEKGLLRELESLREVCFLWGGKAIPLYQKLEDLFNEC